MKKIIGYGADLVALALALYPADAISAAGDALSLCAGTLIPSLFPFFVCANLLISSGLLKSAGRIFEKSSLFLFRVGGEGAAAVLLGLVSGYPAGAAVTCRLYGDGCISKNEAHRLLAFTNNAGPLFIIGAVGVSVYGNPQAGYLLFAAQALASLCTGICMRYTGSDIAWHHTGSRPSASDPMGDAITTVLSLCGFVVFFSVLSAYLRKIGLLSLLQHVLTAVGCSEKTAALLSAGIPEISAVVKSEGGALPAMAGLLSFGGISVMLQTASLVKKAGLSLKPYILGKLLSAGLAAAFCRILLAFFPISVSVSIHTYAKPLAFTGYLAAACLLALGVYLLYRLLCFWDKGLHKKEQYATIKLDDGKEEST